MKSKLSMLKKYFQKERKTWTFLIVLMLLVGFLRGYNFEEWLLFRIDQVRDAEMAQEVLNKGPGSLRLLGPKITKVQLPEENGATSTSHLGPFYYYFQAFSMNLFQSPKPWTIAFPDFILSIFSIPLFFFILRRFFSFKTSALTTIFFGASFLVGQYSRFSWNPNQLIFWHLLMIYFILRFEREKKRAPLFLIIAFSAFLVISHLHFLSMVASFFIFVIYFIFWKGWEKINLKHFLFLIFLASLFYFPVVVSDIKNDGINLKRVLAGISQRSCEESFVDKTTETIEKSSRFYTYFIFPVSKQEWKHMIKFNFIYLVSSLILIGTVFSSRSRFLNEIGITKKYRNLAFLILVYFSVFFLIDFKISSSLGKPRYWLSIAPITFFMLAFWIEFITKAVGKKISNLILIVISFLIIILNGINFYYWYVSLDYGHKAKLFFDKDPILRNYGEFITFGQIERMVDHMAENAKKSGLGVCYFSSDYQTKNSFKYIFKYKYPNIPVKTLEDSNESSKDCKIFVISKKEQDISEVKEDLVDRFHYDEIYRDKALILWSLNVKPGQEKDSRGNEIFKKFKKEEGVVFWGDVFEK